jgi:hypothetical protein
VAGFTGRVAERAESITFVRVLLTVLVAPLFLLGALVAIVWLALRWSMSAFMVGFEGVQARVAPVPPAPESPPAGDG